MSPLSLMPVLPIILIALGTMLLSGRIVREKQSHGRYTSIDGLRGYLAFFVFLHHSTVWYFFLRYHQWTFPPSRIYSHFGPTSVAVFFMITAFLFISKLIDARSGTMDWVKLYVSRILRIIPLYVTAVSVLLLIVGVLSSFSLHVPLSELLVEIFQWFAFIEPDLNNIGGTRLIVAGVVWSLSFEWLFYFSLAFIGAAFFKIRTSTTVLVCTAMFFLFFTLVIKEFYSPLALERLGPFLGGAAAAFLAGNTRIRKFAAGKIASLVILTLLIIGVTCFQMVYEPLSLICISLAFVGIASGNSLFGILTNRTSRLLGQISYSIYLLHGILLFTTFRFILGFRHASSFSPIEHWMIIALCAPVLVVLCSFTYYYIERPFINAAPGIASRIRNYLKGDKPKISQASPDQSIIEVH